MFLKSLKYFPPPLAIHIIASDPEHDEEALDSFWPEKVVCVLAFHMQGFSEQVEVGNLGRKTCRDVQPRAV